MRWFRALPGATPRSRPGGGRSLLLALALAAPAVWCWAFPARPGSGGGAATPPPTGVAAGAEPVLAPIGARQGRLGGRQAAGDPPRWTGAAERPAVELVEVRGRVLAGRLPVVEREIELVALDAPAPASAWDLTDEDGQFAVKLPPGRYGVLLDGVPAPGTLLEVASGAAHVRSDLTLANVAPAD